MSYEFKKSESPKDALARIANELLADMERRLAHPDAQGIHDARRNGKMLRALVKLAGDGLKDAAAQLVKRRIRRMAHLLAGSRDATVRLATFRDLSVPDSSGLEHRLAAEADEEQHHQFSANAQKQARRAAELIEAAFEELNWKKAGWSEVNAGIVRSYRFARKAFGKFRATGTDETLHEWRKRTKDFMYHVRLLQRVRPPKMHRLEKKLDRLAELLGLIHDLIVLTNFVGRLKWLETHRLAVVAELIGERRHKHLRKACRCAERLFEDRPRELRKRLERWR